MGRVHLEALGDARRAHAVAVVEPAAAARGAASALGLATYAGVDELLGAGGFDAALIAAPSDLHVDLVERLSAAGVPVLCEKPCGLRADDARAAAEAAAAAGVLLQVGYWRRFVPELVALRERLVAGELGDISLLACWQWDAEPPSPAFHARSGGISIDASYVHVGKRRAARVPPRAGHASRRVRRGGGGRAAAGRKRERRGARAGGGRADERGDGPARSYRRGQQLIEPVFANSRVRRMIAPAATATGLRRRDRGAVRDIGRRRARGARLLAPAPEASPLVSPQLPRRSARDDWPLAAPDAAGGTRALAAARPRPAVTPRGPPPPVHDKSAAAHARQAAKARWHARARRPERPRARRQPRRPHPCEAKRGTMARMGLGLGSR
jgi:hypothetical protein